MTQELLIKLIFIFFMAFKTVRSICFSAMAAYPRALDAILKVDLNHYFDQNDSPASLNSLYQEIPPIILAKESQMFNELIKRSKKLRNGFINSFELLKLAVTISFQFIFNELNLNTRKCVKTGIGDLAQFLEVWEEHLNGRDKYRLIQQPFTVSILQQLLYGKSLSRIATSEAFDPDLFPQGNFNQQNEQALNDHEYCCNPVIEQPRARRTTFLHYNINSQPTFDQFYDQIEINYYGNAESRHHHLPTCSLEEEEEEAEEERGSGGSGGRGRGRGRGRREQEAVEEAEEEEGENEEGVQTAINPRDSLPEQPNQDEPSVICENRQSQQQEQNELQNYCKNKLLFSENRPIEQSSQSVFQAQPDPFARDRGRQGGKQPYRI